jgi:hypothetical protein
MLSYPRRLQSGHITCYLNRTYHVLTTCAENAQRIAAVRMAGLGTLVPQIHGVGSSSEDGWSNIGMTLVDRGRSSSSGSMLCGRFQSGDHPLACPIFLCELAHAFSLRSHQSDFFNVGSTQPTSNWSSHVLPGSTCPRHSRDNPRPQHLALKFCDCPKNLKSQATRWQCRINVLFQRNEVHAQRFALLCNSKQLSQTRSITAPQ